MFRDRIQLLDKRINPALSRLTWISRGVVDFALDCRRMCREVMELVMTFKGNHKAILQCCTDLSNTMLIHVCSCSCFRSFVACAALKHFF